MISPLSNRYYFLAGCLVSDESAMTSSSASLMILSRALLSSLDAWNVYSIGPLYRVSRLGIQLEILKSSIVHFG